MGWCTLMCDTGAWSPEQHIAAKRQLDIYKERIRPLINNGDLHHISTRPDEARWDGMQYMDSKTGKGIVFAFRGEKSGEASHVFKLKGLARASQYEAWSEDGSVRRAKMSGANLMDDGLTVQVGETGASDLIYLEAQ